MPAPAALLRGFVLNASSSSSSSSLKTTRKSTTSPFDALKNTETLKTPSNVVCTVSYTLDKLGCWEARNGIDKCDAYLACPLEPFDVSNGGVLRFGEHGAEFSKVQDSLFISRLDKNSSIVLDEELVVVEDKVQLTAGQKITFGDTEMILYEKRMCSFIPPAATVAAVQC